MSTRVMGVSRDGGYTWSNETINIHELSSEKSVLNPGDLLWYKRMKFKVHVTEKGILQARIIEPTEST